MVKFSDKDAVLDEVAAELGVTRDKVRRMSREWHRPYEHAVRSIPFYLISQDLGRGGRVPWYVMRTLKEVAKYAADHAIASLRLIAKPPIGLPSLMDLRRAEGLTRTQDAHGVPVQHSYELLHETAKHLAAKYGPELLLGETLHETPSGFWFFKVPTPSHFIALPAARART